MSKNDIKRKIISDLRTINPKKIILFGSFSTGKFKSGKSDIDLLIIKESNKKFADRYSEARLSLSVDFPFDIFVLTENELRDRLENSFFFREIMEKGEIIYEKD